MVTGLDGLCAVCNPQQVHGSDLALLLVIGVGVALLVAFILWREARRRRGRQAWPTAVGFPGVYLFYSGELENLPALRIIGEAMIAISWIAQIVMVKRSGGRLLPTFRRPVRRRAGSVSGENKRPAERRYDEW